MSVQNHSSTVGGLSLGGLLQAASQRASQAQRSFLQARQAALEALSRLVEMQILPAAGRPPALFSGADLQEFASGSIAACLGPAYEIYAHRRGPRIPNGDLLLMSRVLSIEGVRGDLKGGTIASEYDVPASPWYWSENAYPGMPFSFYMEIGMQPCGFLSAYLGAPLLFAQDDLFFRNLDGRGKLLRQLDLRGKTLQVTARLLSSEISGKMVVQSFDFELACQGEPVFGGESVFGFFPAEAMARQMGLDGGRETPAWYQTTGAGEGVSLPAAELPAGRFDLLGDVRVISAGGRYRQGYLYAERKISPADWFFGCHFYQDPVMPGSLGVEAVLQAVWLYARQGGLAARFNDPRFAPAAGQPLVWKYRGQVLPAQQKMRTEVHIRRIEQAAGRALISADASIWADAVRIYEIQNAAISITEG